MHVVKVPTMHVHLHRLRRHAWNMQALNVLFSYVATRWTLVPTCRRSGSKPEGPNPSKRRSTYSNHLTVNTTVSTSNTKQRHLQTYTEAGSMPELRPPLLGLTTGGTSGTYNNTVRSAFGIRPRQCTASRV